VLLVGLLFFGGDYFYITSYTSGGNLYAIVCATMMFPVFASILKLVWTGNAPNFWQIGGYILAAAAILFIAIGNDTS
jgi:drug/metabolite transporter (DMT)-like permease